MAAPQRIVTLSPHAAELVCAAGGCNRIVGVVDYTDFPPRLKQLPHVGNYAALNIEAILALKPDLIVSWQAGNPKPFLRQLKQFNITIIDSSPRRLRDIPAEIIRLGQLMGTAPHAEKVAMLLNRQLDTLRRRYYHPPFISVFYQIWNKPLMTVGADQFISQVIELCGGRNLFNDQQRPALTVSLEAVLTRNSDVILIGGNPVERKAWLSAWQAWPQLTAVQKRHVFFVPPDLLQRPGPRLIAGTALVCHLLEKAKARR